MKRFTLWSLARFSPEGDGGNPPTAGGGGNPPPAGGGGNPPPAPTGLEWMSDLPEDIRAEPTLAKFVSKDSKEALGKISASYLSLRRVASEGGLPMPKTDEDRAKIFEAMGRPKTAGDYAYKADVKKLESAGLKYDEAAGKAFNDLSHKLGLSDAQHGALMKHYWDSITSFAGGMLQARDQEFADGEAALKAEWKGPVYDQNTQIAKAAHAKFGGQEWLDFLDQTGLGNHPLVQKFAYKAGTATMSEEELKGATIATGGMTKEQIEARKSEIKANPAYLDSRHPQHKTLVEEMTRLMAFLHPEAEK